MILTVDLNERNRDDNGVSNNQNSLSLLSGKLAGLLGTSVIIYFSCLRLDLYARLIPRSPVAVKFANYEGSLYLWSMGWVF